LQLIRGNFNTIICKDEAPFAIDVDECASVISFLESSPSSFTLPAHSYHYWTYKTCQVNIANFDDVDYEVCYTSLAYDADITASECLPTTAGGFCAGSQAAGQMFEVLIS